MSEYSVGFIHGTLFMSLFALAMLLWLRRAVERAFKSADDLIEVYKAEADGFRKIAREQVLSNGIASQPKK